MRLVLVEWLDSYGCSSVWQNLTDDAPPVMVCRSVGWLLHDTDDCKVIIPHLSDASHPQTERAQGCGDMTIPTRAVIRLVDLHESPASPS